MLNRRRTPVIPTSMRSDVLQHASFLQAKHTDRFFARTGVQDAMGAAGGGFKLWTRQEFETLHKCSAPSAKRYFTHSTMEDIIMKYPMKQVGPETAKAALCGCSLSVCAAWWLATIGLENLVSVENMCCDQRFFFWLKRKTVDRSIRSRRQRGSQAQWLRTYKPHDFTLAH